MRLHWTRGYFLGFIFVFGAFLAISPHCMAQTSPDLEAGVKPYGSYHGGAFDSVNLTTGKLDIDIPLVSYAQRGGKLSLQFNARYTSATPLVQEICTPPPHTQCLWFATRDGGSSGAGTFHTSSNVPASVGAQNSGEYYSATLADGSTHVFGNTGPNGSGNIWESLDATGLRYDAGAYVLTDASGVRYNFTSQDLFQFVEDPNGNKMNFNSSGIWTDTFDRSITDVQLAAATTDYSGCTGPNTITSANLWTVPAPSNVGSGEETFKFCYVSASYNFQIPFGAEHYTASGNAPHMLQSIVLPNGTAWTFTYDSVYASLASIEFPTGGSISYTWNAPIETCNTSDTKTSYVMTVATRTVTPVEGTAGTWNYSGLGPYPSLVTVTDPGGNDTAHTMTALGGYNMYYEIETEYYQGSRTGGTLLKTVGTTYSYTANPTDYGICRTLIDVAPLVVTTTWANNKVASITKGYDSGFTFYLEGNNSPGMSIYGKVVTETDKDYGTGGPGSTIRTTTTQYEAFVNSSYLTNNLLNLPSSVIVSGGGITAQTDYGYDSGTPASSGAPQHDTSPPTGSYRGNATSITKCINTSCSSSAVTTKTYWDTGLPYVVKDPKLNATTYQYSSSYANALPTTVTDPLGHSSTYAYDFNTGLLTSVTDPNSQVTSFEYDSMWRIASAQYPDGGQATISHQESSFPFTATLTETMSSSQSHSKTNVFDGVGRVTQEQDTDVEGTDYVDTTYDALGRVASVSNPHRSGSNSTDGITSYLYDALGRTTQLTRPDGAIVTTSYTGAATEVTDEGNGTKSVKRVSQADALGRMKSVCEVSSTTLVGGGATPGSCGQDIPVTGFLTTYTLDALGNLWGVAQSGLNARTFVYDSLSRLTSATNPESGTTTYNYDADSNLTSKVSPLPNSTIPGSLLTVNYYYDAGNRITSRTYSDGITPSVTYTYDQDSLDSHNLGYGKGRLSKVTADNGNSIIWNDYDSRGRILNQWQCTALNCSGTALELSYTYDYLGNTLTATNGEGVTFTYSYDTSSRITNVTSSLNDSNHPGTLLSNVAYLPPGEMQSAQTGNGLTETYNYSSREWLTSETIGSAYSLTVGHAPNGSVTSENDSVNGNWTYGYDDFNRLVSSTDTSGSNPPAYSYGYDRFGNRWSQTVTAGSGFSSSLAFDANNHITGSSVGTDIAGDVYSANTGNGTLGFVYYGDGNLDYVTSGGTSQGLYHYDGLGRRTQKTAGSTTYYYYYDLMGHQVAVLDQTGSWKRGEVYAGGKHLVTYTGGTTGHTFFDHGNWLSTERVRTNSTGTVCETISSLPFGDNQVDSDSCTDVSPMHFTGKERDTESNLDDFGARYYSSTLGRWMSPDYSDVPVAVPYADLTNPQSLNLYALVRGNPMTFSDLDGHLLSITQAEEDGTGLMGPDTIGGGPALGGGTAAGVSITATITTGNAGTSSGTQNTPCHDQACHVSPVSDSGNKPDPLAITDPGAVTREITYGVFDAKGNQIKAPVEIKMLEEPENKKYNSCPPPNGCSNKATHDQEDYKKFGTFTDAIGSRGSGSAQFTQRFFVEGGQVPIVRKDDSNGSVQSGWSQTVVIQPRKISINVDPSP